MVKIRLRRMGTKGAPFYRIVVAKSTAGRNGAFIETIGTYNPVAQPKHLAIKNDRALHWLVEGAQPSETVAYLLKKVGVLDEYFAKRPKAKANFKFLDKRTSAISVKSAIAAPAAEKEAPAKAEAVVEAPVEAPVEAVAEAPVEAAAEETAEAPAESAE